jgi:phosphoserine phosphatase
MSTNFQNPDRKGGGTPDKAAAGDPAAPLRLLLLDMDGTLTNVKSPWQFVHEQIGRWEQDGLPLLNRYLAGQLDYLDFCRLDVDTWTDAGLDLAQVEALLDRIEVPTVTVEFLKRAHGAGLKLAIISTGFLRCAHRILDAAGIPPEARLVAANTLTESEGRLRPVIHVGDGGNNGKDVWSRRFLALHGVTSAQAGALGDGETDRPMFNSVGTWWKVRGPEDLAAKGELQARLFGQARG